MVPSYPPKKKVYLFLAKREKSKSGSAQSVTIDIEKGEGKEKNSTKYGGRERDITSQCGRHYVLTCGPFAVARSWYSFILSSCPTVAIHSPVGLKCALLTLRKCGISATCFIPWMPLGPLPAPRFRASHSLTLRSRDACSKT